MLTFKTVSLHHSLLNKDVSKLFAFTDALPSATAQLAQLIGDTLLYVVFQTDVFHNLHLICQTVLGAERHSAKV